MDPKRVVVAAFGNTLEAHLAQSRLQNEGIDAIVDDEFTVNANNLFDVAVGGVKILVPETDAGRAEAILRARPADDAASTVPPDDTVRCPRCGSADVRRPDRPRRIAFLMALLFAFPVWFGLKKWTCSQCGHEWKS